jgi:drug/metabolite transporter (DMT)-like permease
MSKWIGNAVILLAGFFMMLGAAIGIAILFVYAFAVVVLRRLKHRPRPALIAGT